jgi:5,10-methenyltetrahydromethanopterin hydrogenase
MVRGLVKLYTHIHGFIPVTKSGNIFRWIGYTKEEFVHKMIEMSQKAKLEKFDGDIIYELYC